MEKQTNPGDRTLDRLLGPAEPEILCDECFERLDEYVELELRGQAADAEVPGMRAHLRGCSACHEEYESLRRLVQDEGKFGPGPGAKE